MRTLLLTLATALFLLPLPARSQQVNSGSNGSDGALNPTANLVIDMADHPDGIYQYTSVNIPAGVTVSFIPNSGNKPVVWLVQGSVKIAGTIKLDGTPSTAGSGALGGPGGFRGGVAVSATIPAGYGLGPGGGRGSIPYPQPGATSYGGNASFATVGGVGGAQAGAGDTYGNTFLLPLLGGSGGGGGVSGGGCGGGGAILIAASNMIEFVYGTISANGGGLSNTIGVDSSGAGSGGSIRLVCQTLHGIGSISAQGGWQYWRQTRAGDGRIRLDSMDNSFVGGTTGQITRGFQPIIIPAPGQGIQLDIQSVAGTVIAANPSGVLVNPDVVIPAQQTNPIPIVVKCTNVPLNSEIMVIIQPANGSPVQAVGLNNTGTLASSTATVSVNMPRGGGTIYAKAVTGLGGNAMNGAKGEKDSIASTGWTAEGERFKSIEVTATLGAPQRIAYITESGKRFEIN